MKSERRASHRDRKNNHGATSPIVRSSTLRRTVVVATLTVAAWAALPDPSAMGADPDPDPAVHGPGAEPSIPRVWYGWQIALVDVGSAGSLGLATRLPGAAGGLLAIAGTAGYLLGGPLIHGWQGRAGGVIAASVGLRLGLPLVGFIVGVALGEPSVARCESDGQGDALASALCPFDAVSAGIVGGAIGMAAASLTDSLALSWKPRASSDAAATHPSFVPTFATVRDAERRVTTTLGVRGSF
jgi:hypothetical protein